MDIVSGSKADMPDGLYAELAIYRHKVFVEMLGWELHTDCSYELDQFDRPDTVYVIVRDDAHRITGCARLLPTTKPYLLAEFFPQLLNGLPAPCAEDVWELSRFAAVDVTDASRTARDQLSSPVAVTLLQNAIQTASILGARRLITVSPIGVERLLRQAGFRAQRAGPPMVIGGHPLFGCWIDVESERRPPVFSSTRLDSPVVNVADLQPIQNARQCMATDGALGHDRDGLVGCVIHDRHALDDASLGGAVEQEVHRPT